MNMDLKLGRRVFQHSLIVATTLLTCNALQADEHENKQQRGDQTAQYGDKAGKHGDKAEQFIQKALMSGQMEQQMGELGQQKAQNPEVKTLASTMARDHKQANERLQQLAATKNVQLTQKHGEHGKKHQQALNDLRNASGQEFDRQFVKAALKHHKKDIAEFEKCQKEVNDSELRAFIDQTLPKLRTHLQMAQTAARAVGVDESSIAADIDADSDVDVGAPAAGERGTDRRSLDTDVNIDTDGSNLDGATETDRSGTINQNNPRTDSDLDVDANADLDTRGDGASFEADADVDDGGVFQKGDGKVLGLPTDKNDGKFLGIIPNPRADRDNQDADIEADVDIDTERNTDVGSPAQSETGRSEDRPQ